MTTVDEAFERIETWLAANAPELANNLARPAPDADLETLEAQAGFLVPDELLALWKRHGGQRDTDTNVLFGALSFVSPAQTLAERTNVLHTFEAIREDDDTAPVAHKDELKSDEWLPFAAMDGEWLLVSAVSGRVFRCLDEGPALQLEGESLAEWLLSWAKQLEQGEFELVDGFGGKHLARKKSAYEAHVEQVRKEEAELEAYRKNTPLLQQVQERTAAQANHGVTYALGRIIAERPTDLPAALDALWASSPTRAFLSTVLRGFIPSITLTPDRWVDLAESAVHDDNRAVRQQAAARAVGHSVARREALRLAVEKVKNDPDAYSSLKVAYEQLLVEVTGTPSATPSQSATSVSVSRRVLAKASDIVIVAILMGVGLALDPAIQTRFQLFVLFCFLASDSGLSLGKALAGIQVVDAKTGQPGSISQAVFRNLPLCVGPLLRVVAANTGMNWATVRSHAPMFAAFVSGVSASLAIAEVLALWGDRPRLGDRLANTRVIRKP